MRLGLRIGFFVALTAILPLLLLAFAATQVARTHAEERMVDFQVAAARSIGALVARQLEDTERVLTQQVANFRLGQASDPARSAFLLTTYRLFPEIAIALLLGAEGEELVAPLYQPEGPNPELPDHEQVGLARLARFRQQLEPPPARGGVAIGAPYQPEGSDAAAIPVLLASPWDDDVSLAVELSLAPLASRMTALTEGREIALLAENGDVLLRAGEVGLIEPERTRALTGNPEVDLRYRTQGGVAVLAGLARVPGREWTVVVAEPADAVAQTIAGIRDRTWYIGAVALMMALAGGTYLTRSITGPVVRLRDAATAVGRGEFERRVHEQGRDELVELAQAFNRMSASLQHNAAEIAAKNEEIERFNLELQQRVDQRTAQLREAQARLVQSGQLAAVGELSAGLAHELNNPLAGILGLLQIVVLQLRDRPEAALLRSAEAEALRCKEIVANLMRFTRTAPDLGQGSRDVVDLVSVVRDVLALVGTPFRERGITVSVGAAATPLNMRGDATQLGRAMGQLLTSLRAVAAPDSSLHITSRSSQTEVELHFAVDRTVSDSDDWRAAALGFWVARQVFQDHAATLDEPAGAPGEPRSWRLSAPASGEPRVSEGEA